MPDGFKLGSAFIEVNPDARDFKPKLDEALKKDKTEVKVKVSPDTTGFKDRMEADLKRSKSEIKVKLNPDTAAFNSKIDALVRKDDFKHVKIKVDLDKSQTDSLFKDAGGGAGKAFLGAFGSSGGGGGGGGSSLLTAPLSSPYGIGAAIAAGLVALPFIAETAAAGIVTAFGGTIAGMAIVGAFQNKAVKKSFTDLKDSAVSDLGQIGKSFVPVMENIFGTAKKTLDKLTPVFSAAATTISKPFEKFSDTLIKAFGSPQVKKSISEVAGSFGALLNALGPQIGPDINQIAGAIGRIANTIAAHPQDFASFVRFLTNIATFALDAIDWLTKVAQYITEHFGPALHRISNIFDGVRHEVSHIWDMIYHDTIGAVIRYAHDVAAEFDRLGKQIINILDSMRHEGAHIWDLIYRDTIGAVIRMAKDIYQNILDIKKNITNWINDVRRTLSSAWDGIYHDVSTTWSHIANDMHNWWSDFINFITGKVNTVKSTLSNTWNDIWNDVKHVWGQIEGFFDGVWRHIQTGVVNAVSGFARAWGNIENAFKRPVNFLIQTVYDDGIRGFWNKIVNAVGLKSLDLPNISTLAHGGIIPGYAPGVDNQPAILSKGESVLTPGATLALGHDNINALNAAFQPRGGGTSIKGGVLHAAGGFNPIGSAIGAVKSVGTSLGHDVGSAINAFKDVTSIVAALATGNTTALTNDLGKVLGTNAAGDLAKVMLAIPKTLVTDLVKKLGSMTAGLLGGTSGPLGGATGSEMANGIELYKYLLTNLFGGSKVAAAGATASIWGESTWNPFAQGTGGRGLIGWTPPGTISNAAFSGGMATQLPAIIEFVTRNGDMGVVDRMKSMSSVTQAAYAWGKGVERYGIPDVHPAGLALASQIMNKYAGGTVGAAPGWAWVGEEGPELVKMHGGETVLDSTTSMYMGGAHPGYASGTMDAHQKHLAHLAHLAHLGHPAVRKSVQTAAQRKAATALTAEQKRGNTIISALAATFSGGGLPTSGNITSDLSSALKAITTYYHGGKAKNLEVQLQDQANHMKQILAKDATVTATIAAAKTYAASVTSNLTGYADLSNLGAVPTSGSGVKFGTAVKQALTQRLSALSAFNTLLKQAANKKISSAFLQQAIAMGPDGGTQYLQAILAGDSGLIATINKIETQTSALETGIGQSAANLLYDPTAMGKGFLTGLQSQQTALNKTMQSLGSTFAKTVAHDLKIPVKSLPHFASGGIAQAGTLAVVGENGPEMVRFNQTGQVYNARQTAQMMGPQGEVNINFFGPQYPTPEQIANLKLEFTKQMNGYNV